MYILIYVACFFTYSLGKTNSEVIVTLPNGQIRGRIEVTYSNVTFYAFQQIPYAEPPVGKLRFKAPQPAKHWENVLDCTTETKICRQMNMNNSMENEDCLYLNVYTPVNPGSNSTLPVMYYIYGGGFEHGSATFVSSGPHYFMEYEVVIVTVNYRTGPFGFLSTVDTVIPGNNGLKDQSLGLKWVQENIHLFGGDPKKVTIFGQSAGGASVTYQLLSKQSEGLFRAAIAQSGSALCPWAYQRHARDIAYQFAALFNSTFAKNQSTTELLELLQNQKEEDIALFASNFKPEGVWGDENVQGYYFSPVIEPDHEEAFLSQRQYELLESGNFTKVPLMIGICSEEKISRAADLASFKKTVENLELDIKNLLPEDLHMEDEGDKIAAGKQIRNIYTDDKFANDLSAAVRYYSDTAFTRSIIRYAFLESQYTDVYFYQFSYYGNMSRFDEIILNGTGKVQHASDTHYQWTINNQSNVHVFSDNDVLTHERYMKLFTDFSKYLNPTPEKSDLIQNLTLPKVTKDTFWYLDIDKDLEIKVNPKGDTYTKWVEVYDTWGVQPYDTY